MFGEMVVDNVTVYCALRKNKRKRSFIFWKMFLRLFVHHQLVEEAIACQVKIFLLKNCCGKKRILICLTSFRSFPK